MIKIMHLGDFHMDCPFDALDREKAAIRQREIRQTIASALSYANEEQVDIVLMAGDLFDSHNSYYDTISFLKNEFSKTKAKIFIAPGNHDFYAEGSLYSTVDWPEHVHIFKTPAIERVEAITGVFVYGAAFLSEHSPALLTGFHAHVDDGLSLMVLHGDITSMASRYNPISKNDIEQSGLHYLALGHIHERSQIKKLGKTSFAYSGCIEGRGFDETLEKGVYIGGVSKDRVDLQFKRLCLRVYEVVELNITGVLNTEELIRYIESKLPPHGAENLCKLVLTGDASFLIEPDKIEEAFHGRFFYLSVRDETRVPENIWERLEEDTLIGAFLRKIKHSYDEAKEEQKQLKELTVRIGLKALQNERMDADSFGFKGEAKQ